MTKCGLDIFNLEHLLITHTHEDHFDMAEIVTRECAVPVFERPLYIYLNKHGADWASNLLVSYLPGNDPHLISKFLDTYRIIPVDYFETFKAGDLEVTSLKANHKAFGQGEYGQNYIIKLKDGRKLLYALDTGWYCDETWEFIKDKKIDILIMESTFGGAQDRDIHPNGHLDIKSMLLMLEKMNAIGFIDDEVKIFTSHINHKHSLMHEDMQKAFNCNDFKVIVAYDGLEIK